MEVLYFVSTNVCPFSRMFVHSLESPDFTYISNNKTAGKDIRYNIPGHFSFATFYTYTVVGTCINKMYIHCIKSVN